MLSLSPNASDVIRPRRRHRRRHARAHGHARGRRQHGWHNIHLKAVGKVSEVSEWRQKNKERISGCTVHHVNDKLDSGNIILKKSFSVEDKDNELSLKRKTQKMEYKAFSEAIVKLYR